MPDVFISYSKDDGQFADFLYRHLGNEGLDVFMASISLMPGQQWTPQIINQMNASRWVLFLASKAACSSPFVQQEMGAAVFSGKKVVPIVWDIDPSNLPGWTNQHQALNLAGSSTRHIYNEISKIAEIIKADKRKGQIIAGLLVAGLIALSIKQ